ncbi:MAG: DUF1499 domain-containing protein [Desulfobacteraceae bacterium]|nr:MAG: DUF1499 domain-containing protein [Desulfobacteraceae bacterium]
MRIALLIILSVAIAGVAVFEVLGRKSGAGEPPGLSDGRLKACGQRPNCVCSEYPGDPAHYTEPIPTGNRAKQEVMRSVRTVIKEMGGTIEGETEDYLAVIFKSRLFRFVDDFEVRLDRGNRLLHLRSSSRVGHSDMGANQKRIERFKEIWIARHSGS